MNSCELKVEVPLATAEDYEEEEDKTHINANMMNSTPVKLRSGAKDELVRSLRCHNKGLNRVLQTEENSCSGSLEDLVNSFDDKLAAVLKDYHEDTQHLAPVQKRTKEEVLADCQVWWTLTGNFGNLPPLDWNSSSTRAAHLPSLHLDNRLDDRLDDGKFGDKYDNSRFRLGLLNESRDDLDEDEVVAADLDMHSLILDSHEAEKATPVQDADEVLREIDDLLDEADFDDNSVEMSNSNNDNSPTNKSDTSPPMSDLLKSALNGRRLEDLSATELSRVLSDLELLVKDLSETLVVQLGLRDELEDEKELRNAFISTLLAIQSKRRQNGKSKYLTTAIPYHPDDGPLDTNTLHVLVKILKAICDDSPAVPTLLTDYILKVLCPK